MQQAYMNICSNYTDGEDGKTPDRIYLFGFSRGAVIARITATLISRYGLLKPSQIGHFVRMWTAFLTEDKGANFSAFCHRDAQIDFLGVFDSVLGNYSGRDYEVLNRIYGKSVNVPAKVKRAVQILTIDETRGRMLPSIWGGTESNATVCDEIWMPGVHTDIGGGYTSDFLAGVSLLSMLEKLKSACPNLSLAEDDIEDLEKGVVDGIKNNKIVINNEKDTPFWKVAGVFRDGTRTIEKNGAHQYLHPLCHMLKDRFVTMKGKTGTKPQTKIELPTCRGLDCFDRIATELT
jgi:T6SS, Phospholipase effector Tle1-like, catalytic domain